MTKIFLPIDVSNNQCAVMVSDGHIRVYDRVPNGTTINNVHYYDFYIRDDYIQTEGTANFNNYTTYNCINSSNFTTDYWYRLDIDKIVTVFLAVAIVGIYFPYKIFSRFLGRWLKL